MILYSLSCHNKFPEEDNLIGSLLSVGVWVLWRAESNALAEARVIEASGDLSNSD